MSTTIHDVHALLELPRVALVGASHQHNDFSRLVMKKLLERGYDVVPVNLRPGLIEGRPAVASVEAIEGPVDWALVMVPPAAAAAVVEECARAGIGGVWLHRGAGLGSATPEAEEAARRHGMTVVSGECPFMFLDPTGPHAIHGAVRRLGGGYPRDGVAPPEPWVVRGLAAIQVLLGLAALVAGAMLVFDPTGAALGLAPAMLSGPFTTFLVPGLVLLIVHGVGRMGALGLTLRRRGDAPLAALGLGVFTLLWIGAQLLWFEPVHAMQVAVLALGVAEIALSLRWSRRAPGHRRPPTPQRREAPAAG